MNSIRTCRLYPAYTESGRSLSTLNLLLQAQTILAADCEPSIKTKTVSSH